MSTVTGKMRIVEDDEDDDNERGCADWRCIMLMTVMTISFLFLPFFFFFVSV